MSISQVLRQCRLPGSAGFQPAPEAGETPALPGNWQGIYETDLRSVLPPRTGRTREQSRRGVSAGGWRWGALEGTLQRCQCRHAFCFSYPLALPPGKRQQAEQVLAAQTHKVEVFPLHTASSTSAWIERTPHASATALQHVRVDHGCVDVLVSEEFLDRTDIVAILQQVGRKAVAVIQSSG